MIAQGMTTRNPQIAVKRIESAVGTQATLRGALFEFGEAPLELALFAPLRRVVARNRSDHAASGRVEQRHGEGDRQRLTVLAQRWDAQHGSLILARAGHHHLAIAFPMAPAKALGNDEVERLAQRLGFE